MTTKEMTDRELDALVAEICGWCHHNDRWWRESWPDIHNTVTFDKVPHCSTDIASAFLVEDRIAELGLQTRYVLELAKIVDPRNSRADAVALLWWDMVHATPRQRCEAALAALGEPCEHNWIDATNEVVSGTAYCSKCGKLESLSNVTVSAVEVL